MSPFEQNTMPYLTWCVLTRHHQQTMQ